MRRPMPFEVQVPRQGELLAASAHLEPLPRRAPRIMDPECDRMRLSIDVARQGVIRHPSNGPLDHSPISSAASPVDPNRSPRSSATPALEGAALLIQLDREVSN